MSSAFLNRVQLIGNLGLDPERRQFQSGGSVVRLRLATSESYRDGRGERVERTEWHSVAVWPDGLQDLVSQYLRKGDKVLVEGKLRTTKWQDQSGADRTTTEIHVTPYDGQIKFLSPRRDGADTARTGSDQAATAGETGNEPTTGRSQRGADPRRRAPAETGAGRPAAGGELDDDIPF